MKWKSLIGGFSRRRQATGSETKTARTATPLRAESPATLDNKTSPPRSPRTPDADLLARLTETALLRPVNNSDWVFVENHDRRVAQARDQLIALLVSEESDQGVLSQIARTHPVTDVRLAAAKKLSDQTFLMRDRNYDVRIAAVKKLTDAHETLLAEVAVKDDHKEVRRAAVERLDDQALLAKIAVQDKDSFVRSAAVNRLKGQGMLAKIAVEEEDEFIRAAAFGRLSPIKR
jgi:hypothetical protein